MVHSNPESDGGCQTYPAARENMEPDPLKEPGETPRKNSVERLPARCQVIIEGDRS